jgi:hypothetical protein
MLQDDTSSLIAVMTVIIGGIADEVLGMFRLQGLKLFHAFVVSSLY